MVQPQIAWAKEWLGQAKKLYIDGQWQEAQGERQWSVINPANQETLCKYSRARPLSSQVWLVKGEVWLAKGGNTKYHHKMR